jgi:hypothetical protein
MLLLRLLRGLAQDTSEKNRRSWAYRREMSLPGTDEGWEW